MWLKVHLEHQHTQNTCRSIAIVDVTYFCEQMIHIDEHLSGFLNTRKTLGYFSHNTMSRFFYIYSFYLLQLENLDVSRVLFICRRLWVPGPDISRFRNCCRTTLCCICRAVWSSALHVVDSLGWFVSISDSFSVVNYEMKLCPRWSVSCFTLPVLYRF